MTGTSPTDSSTFTPRRSVLYMPGANVRALEKAATLPCDGLIFDLEDAVSPDAKTVARSNVATALGTHDYGYRERVVRVNGLDTPWGYDDLTGIAGLAVDAVLFPKIDTPDMLAEAGQALRSAWSGTEVPVPSLWAMIESPRSVLNLPSICGADPALRVLVMGTSDLVRDLRAQHTPSREPLLFALSRAVTVARAEGLDILDGVHLDFRNLESFEATCEQGRAMGFDGRSLIHPSQVAPANRIFGLGQAEVEHARRVIEVWGQAQAQGRGVVELDGQLIENLHAADATRLLAIAQQLQARDATD